MTTKNADHHSTSSRSEAMTADTHALMSRAPERDSQHSKSAEVPPDAESASPNQKVVAEATRLLSLLMEFGELERLRQEKDRA
jgi:hypothetical protein